MHILVGLLGVAAAVYFFFIRARHAADVAHDVVEMAGDVRGAARRFGFKRKTNVHPVETIEDPNLAIAAIATAFVEMDDLPTKEQRDALDRALRSQLGMDASTSQEATILGHWFVSECHGPETAVPRVSRKLFKLNGKESFEQLLNVINTAVGAGSGALNQKQRDALDDIRRAFRVS